MTISFNNHTHLYNVQITTADGQSRYVAEWGDTKKDAMRKALYKAEDWASIVKVDAFAQHITAQV